MKKDLDLLRHALATLFNEVHHPGYSTEAKIDLDDLYNQAMGAIRSLNNIRRKICAGEQL